MTLESVEKLRELVKSFHSLKPRWDTLAAIDEVEREIERDYMKLPVDADGVPIHVGDVMKLKQCGERIGTVTAVGKRVEARAWVLPDGKNVSISYIASGIKHVNPRTLEDVLRDVWKEALDYAKSDIWRNPDEVFAERADEIRELMEVDT